MTLDEATKLAAIISSADSGCENCVQSLVNQANEVFPEFCFVVPDDWYESGQRVQVFAASTKT